MDTKLAKLEQVCRPSAGELCALPVAGLLVLFGKNGFLNGSVVVDGPSLYCANGRGGYLMKKLCNFWGVWRMPLWE